MVAATHISETHARTGVNRRITQRNWGQVGGVKEPACDRSSGSLGLGLSISLGCSHSFVWVSGNGLHLVTLTFSNERSHARRSCSQMTILRPRRYAMSSPSEIAERNVLSQNVDSSTACARLRMLPNLRFSALVVTPAGGNCSTHRLTLPCLSTVVPCVVRHMVNHTARGGTTRRDFQSQAAFGRFSPYLV